MDENKLALLRQIGYKIQPTCKTCKHRSQEFAVVSFGTCKVHQYTHLKHTGPPRDMSIHELGYCDQYERDDSSRFIEELDRYKEFMS